MRMHLLATTAVAALMASGMAYAQAPGQKHDEKAQAQDHKAAPNRQPLAAKQDHARDQQARKEKEQPKNATQQAQETQPKGNAGHAMKKTAQQPSKAGEQATSTRDTAMEKQSRKQNHAQAKASHDRHDAAAANKDKMTGKKDGKTNSQAKASEQQKAVDQKAAQSKQSIDPSKGRNKNAAQNPAPSQSTKQAADKSGAASTKLSETDRAKVFSTLKSGRHASRQNVNIQVSVGERLPPRLHSRALPSTIVRTMPQFRGYEYVMIRDEIAIVRPGTREVVEVIHEPGTSFAESRLSGGSSRTTIHLTEQQRASLRSEAHRFVTSQVSGSGSQCLSLRPVPSSLVSQNPKLRSYQMLAIGDDVILVDPSQKKVVDVIQ